MRSGKMSASAVAASVKGRAHFEATMQAQGCSIVRGTDGRYVIDAVQLAWEIYCTAWRLQAQ